MMYYVTQWINQTCNRSFVNRSSYKTAEQINVFKRRPMTASQIRGIGANQTKPGGKH